jgi:hypothetical protein
MYVPIEVIYAISAVLTIGIPALILLGMRGYKQDERRQQRRSGKDGRSGGRREDDVLPPR